MGFLPWPESVTGITAGETRRGTAGLGAAGQGRHGVARPGPARQGRRGSARRGAAWQGKARRGVARLGAAWQGTARPGSARQGKAGKARRGRARLGAARQGSAGRRRHNQRPPTSPQGMCSGADRRESATRHECSVPPHDPGTTTGRAGVIARTSNRRAAVGTSDAVTPPQAHFTGRAPSLKAGSCGAPSGAFLACLNYLNGPWNTGA